VSRERLALAQTYGKRRIKEVAIRRKVRLGKHGKSVVFTKDERVMKVEE
jgi:hypothetical protein